MHNPKRLRIAILITILVGMISGGRLMAQNRGNNFAFQGLGNTGEISAKALALGGAYTSINGDIDAIQYNPAGLATIDRLQLSFGAGMLSRAWTENQVYNQNRLFYTLPFYLERLYIPDPANNGKLDSDVFFDGLVDTAYVVAFPDTGLEPFSDAAADWKKKKMTTGPTNFAIAYPFLLSGKNVVVAAAWNKKMDFFDYDRNSTYLDPHLGYTEYDLPDLVNGLDTIRMSWSDFERSRSGSLQEFQAAVAIDLSKHIKTGFAFRYLTGETDDMLILNKIGDFDLIDQNEFAFSYDTLDLSISGSSDFSGLKTELGLQLQYDAFGFGLNVVLPYTVKRDFSYAERTTNPQNDMTNEIKGLEMFRVPLGYALGINLRPAEKFVFSLDYDLKRFSKAEWEIANNDTTHRNWVDQQILRLGIQYAPFQVLSLRAGYRAIPQVFVPDGAPYRDKGPEARAWTVGFGLNLGQLGLLDVAGEYRILKYYDQYFSNTNYCKEVTKNLLIGYHYFF